MSKKDRKMTDQTEHADHLLEARRLVNALVVEMAHLQREVEDYRALAKQPDLAFLSTKIEDTELPSRIQKALIADDIRTVSDLVQKTGKYLETVPNFGRAGLDSVRFLLGLRGLYLGMK